MDVELKSIHKSFGEIHANENITLTVPAGTIQGLLGENGAGKSTLMKILSGFIQQDRGDIFLDGKKTIIDTPADAIKHGVGMLHQDPLDFPPMTVLDNFIIGRHGSLFPDKDKIFKEFQDSQNQFGFSLDPQAYVDTLTVGERQQLEILRLLSLGARVLILDEPTTGISAQQKRLLFSTLKILAEQEKTIIFVSHKLEDVEELCTQIAVLRKGKLVGETKPPYETDQLVRLMFGKLIVLGDRLECASEEPLLKLQNLEIADPRLTIRDVNFNLCEGEVIGLAGMEGSGQDILLRSCAGLVRPTGGKIIINNRNMTGKTYHAFMREGIKFLPASRMEEGLIPGLTIRDHFILAEKDREFFINENRAQQLSSKGIDTYSVKGTPMSPVESLSGGNQQRLMLALLQTPLRILLLEHPTRGLDIESSIYVWKKLKERCQHGTGILFISPDLEEILQYSDRVIVFYSGRVTAPIPAAEIDLDQLGMLIGGKGWQEIEYSQVSDE